MPENENTPQESLNILIVEDDPNYRKLVGQCLPGHKRTGAESAAEAEKVIESMKPDIVFLDISLPDASGYTVLEKLKSKYPDIFVVMVTSSCLKQDFKHSCESGASYYIVKPFSRKKIDEAIALYYQKRENSAKKEG